jgi:hypothetical protein
MKKTDRKWDEPKQAEFMRKWKESSWKCFIYIFFTIFVFAVREPQRPAGVAGGWGPLGRGASSGEEAAGAAASRLRVQLL